MNPTYKRVYHYHVRKTAGTSLNSAFWELGDLTPMKLSEPSEFKRNAFTGNGLKFVRHDSELIAAGDYFYAYSHLPTHRVQIPSDSFTVTILRDPVARVVSYYRHLLWARANPRARDIEPAIDQLWVESTLLDGGFRKLLWRIPPRRRAGRFRALLWRNLPRLRAGNFRNFLARIPPDYLLAQVYMFSERMDPMEAAERALACSAVCFTETFSEDLKRIALILDLDLRERQERRFDEKVALTATELALLRERLAPEYAMIERVREGLRERI